MSKNFVGVTHNVPVLSRVRGTRHVVDFPVFFPISVPLDGRSARNASNRTVGNVVYKPVAIAVRPVQVRDGDDYPRPPTFGRQVEVIKRVGMGDFARAAGISNSTLTRYVNELGRVNRATERVIIQTVMNFDRLQFLPI